jgi:triacylglycerol lipase
VVIVDPAARVVADSTTRFTPWRLIRRLLTWLGAIFAVNVVGLFGGLFAYLGGVANWALPWRLLSGLAAIAIYGFINIRPCAPAQAPATKTTNRLLAGYELLLAAGVAGLSNIALWIWLGLSLHGHSGAGGWALFIGNAVVGLIALLGLALGGFIRVAMHSTQVPLSRRLFLLFFWWFPPTTVLVIGPMMRIIDHELGVTALRERRDAARCGSAICATRYPLLMVHGVFFRDWSAFNYWGRIPDQLEAFGARIHYGGQQSSASVAQSAAELAATIRRIVAETGCGKVNIIAHSKGGLDARWAISQLGVADLVASLTTINTPHRGCNFARQLLEKIPDKVVGQISSSYDNLFSRLGDVAPDFLGGVVDLTDTECARLNQAMPDAAGVLYQSLGSMMASRFAAPFPLNLGYSLIQPVDGDNDGLVAVSSMAWGNWLGVIRPSGKQGISHADMIDLLRRDIGDFDVVETYVQLVDGLRRRGY